MRATFLHAICVDNGDTFTYKVLALGAVVGLNVPVGKPLKQEISIWSMANGDVFNKAKKETDG